MGRETRHEREAGCRCEDPPFFPPNSTALVVIPDMEDLHVDSEVRQRTVAWQPNSAWPPVEQAFFSTPPREVDRVR